MRFVRFVVKETETYRPNALPIFNHEGHEDHEATEPVCRHLYRILRALRALRGERDGNRTGLRRQRLFTTKATKITKRPNLCAAICAESFVRFVRFVV
ncbi:MAG: hypothetical protein WCG26_07605, partial [Chloroflexales bacterium]